MLWSLIPLPYRLLLVVTGSMALYASGYIHGRAAADATAQIETLTRDKAALSVDLAAANAQMQQYQKTIAQLSEVSHAAALRADAADKLTRSLEEQYGAYIDGLSWAPTCALTGNDVRGLRAIGGSKSGHSARAVQAERPPASAAP
jgi:hypothetical protein